MEKACIIVIGITHHNTIGLVRCIGMAGYMVDHLILTEQNNKSFVARSKYVKQTYYCPDEKLILDTLLALHDNDRKMYLVIPCTDTAVSLLDINYELLKKQFVFFNAGTHGAVSHFMNKKIQADYAYKAGLNVPYSIEYNGRKQDLSFQQIENDKCTFPCILKYTQSINGGKRIKVCNNKQELTKALDYFGNDNSVLIQKFIQKKFEIVLLGLSINGNVYIPGYILKHREFNGGTNYSTVLPVDDNLACLIEKCKMFVHSISYEGLFGIEFINNGQDYFFVEINLRTDATTYALAVAGANLPQLYIKSKVDHTQPDNKVFKVRTITSMVEFNDFKHRKEYGISIWKWLREFWKTDCKYYFSLKDPKPFFLAPFK